MATCRFSKDSPELPSNGPNSLTVVEAWHMACALGNVHALDTIKWESTASSESEGEATTDADASTDDSAESEWDSSASSESESSRSLSDEPRSDESWCLSDSADATSGTHKFLSGNTVRRSSSMRPASSWSSSSCSHMHVQINL